MTVSLRLGRFLGLATLAALVGCTTAPTAPPAPVDVPPPQMAAPILAPAPLVDAPQAEPTAPAASATAPVRRAEAWRNRERAKLPADPAHSDLWLRIRQGFAMQDVDDDLVRKWEVYYASRPEYMARMVERSSRYMFHIVEEVDSRGLPMELALLPFIESAFNPQAMSSARAAGMWQFVASTGREFDLKQNVFRDDRRDVIASTRAALDYLEQLHGQFDDWQLALAAYNWGQGSVQRAQRRNDAKRRPVDYGSLDMPAETRNYVPKLLAVKNIVLHPHDFGLELPRLENHPFFLGVGIERDMDVDIAARLAGLSVAEFQQFNPQMNQPVILAAGTPQLLLPYDNANQFLRALDQHRGPLATWTAWVAPRTMAPSEAARLVGMSEAALREVNRIPARMRVKAGSTLLVPRGPNATEDVDEHLADHAAILLAPDALPTRRVVLKAGRKGETVAGIARRYGLSTRDVARWNRLRTDGSFRAGASIVVMLPQKSTATGRGSKRSTAGSTRTAKNSSAKTRVAPR